MISISLPWASIKIKTQLKYAEANGNYYVYCVEGSVEYSCVIDCASSDGADFADNYLSEATKVN